MQNVFISFVFVFVTACSGPEKETQSKQEVIEETKDSVVLGKGEEFPQAESIQMGEFQLIPIKTEQAKASLQWLSPKEGSLDSARVYDFHFKLEDFDLGERRQLNVLINGGEPYSSSNTDFSMDLLEGNNVTLAYLNDTQAGSLKQAEAFQFRNLAIGDDLFEFPMQDPMLFYLSPKEEVAANQKVLLDFFLLNAELAADGVQVKLQIDEETLLLSNWQAFELKGLTVGIHQIRLQLVDENQEVLQGPFTDSGLRKIEVKP